MALYQPAVKIRRRIGIAKDAVLKLCRVLKTSPETKKRVINSHVSAGQFPQRLKRSFETTET